MPIPVTVKRVGLTVDLLLFQAYGRAGNSDLMLARTLSDNRGLAALGAELPLGTALTLPDLETKTPTRKRAAVNLFGDS